jgi:hypothetical protein
VVSLPFVWASISSSSIAEFFFSKASKELCKCNKCFHQKAFHSKADGTMGNQKVKKWEGDGAPLSKFIQSETSKQFIISNTPKNIIAIKIVLIRIKFPSWILKTL